MCKKKLIKIFMCVWSFLCLINTDLFGMQDHFGLINFSPEKLIDVICKPCGLKLDLQFAMSSSIMSKNHGVFFPDKIKIGDKETGSIPKDGSMVPVDSSLLRRSEKYCSGRLTIQELAFMIIFFRHIKFFAERCAFDKDFNSVCTKILTEFDGDVPDAERYIKQFLTKSLD